MKTFMVSTIFVIFNIISIFAEDPNTMAIIPTDESVVSSCSLSLKVNPIYSSSNQVPKAAIEITLLGMDGIPISGVPIQLTATLGTFLCNDSANSSTSDYSCFTTNSDGKTVVTLTNIKFNSPIRIKASCSCGDYQVNATGNVLISKKVSRKK